MENSHNASSSPPSPHTSHSILEHLKHKPLADPTILDKKGTSIVAKVKTDNVIPSLKGVLSDEEIDGVTCKPKLTEKNWELHLCLRPEATGNCKAFNAFLMALAGTQPELFLELVGRDPTNSERDFCIQEYSTALRESIKDSGHVSDSPLDVRIDFATQHVRLMVTKTGHTKDSFEFLHHREKLIHHQKKTHTSPLHLLDSQKHQKLAKVLLKGRPGTGKTITCQYLCHKWSLGEWQQQFSVLFLIPLRFLVSCPDKMTAFELLTSYCLFQTPVKHYLYPLSSWIQNNNSKFLLFLDGLDEVSWLSKLLQNPRKITNPYMKANPIDICVNILKGNLFPGCMVISASRPFSGLQHIDFDSQYEILALTENQIQEFVEKHHPNQVDCIMSQLHSSALLMSICSIVFYCSLVSRLLVEGVVFRNEDIQTYTSLMSFILIHFVERSSQRESDSPFIMAVNPYFSNLAALAYNGVYGAQLRGEVSKLVFDEYSILRAQITEQMCLQAQQHGLLQTQAFQSGFRHSIIATFPHLSMQELLASAYMTTHGENSVDVFRQLFSTAQFNMALLYLYGFQYDIKSMWVKDIKLSVGSAGTLSLDESLQSFIQDLCEDKESRLKVCQVLHEGQMEKTAKAVSQFVVPNGKLIMQKTQLTMIDLMSIRFVTDLVENLQEVEFYECGVTDMLSDYLGNSILTPHVETVKCVNLQNNHITKTGVKFVAKCLSQSTTLQELMLRSNRLHACGVSVIADAFLQDRTLKRLDLVSNTIRDEGVIVLAQALHHNDSLQVLDIGGNFITSVGVVALGEALLHNRTLQDLNIAANSSGPVGATAIASALHHNKSLKKLNLWANNIKDEGATALAQALENNHSLVMLNLEQNSITSIGAESLAKALHHNTSIQELYLRDNDIDDVTKAALNEAAAAKTDFTIDLSYDSPDTSGSSGSSDSSDSSDSSG